MEHFTSFFLKSILLVKRAFLLSVTFAVAVLDLISRAHLASFVISTYVLARNIFSDGEWTVIRL
jgi:hypothetical protein